jgi:hypothetical protein
VPRKFPVRKNFLEAPVCQEMDLPGTIYFRAHENAFIDRKYKQVL